MHKGKNATLKDVELKRLEEIKKLVVVAMFSDNELMERLVLKGGNALDLIHELSTRSLVDVDSSTEDDFPKEGRGGVLGSGRACHPEHIAARRRQGFRR